MCAGRFGGVSGTMRTDVVIDVKDVHKSFKQVKAVRGISLRITGGQFLALLGPNGAGKTTLVEMIEGIQKPDSGDILIMGRHWRGNADALHRIIGLSLQETHFIDKLNVWETLILFAGFFDLGKKRAEEVMAGVGLAEKRKSYTVNLSGGQRQRLALGIALLNKPRILLLDEPTTGLDPNARREIWDILKSLKHEGRTSLVLTTHYMEEAEQLCDDIVIMDRGRILRRGTLAELLQSGNGGNIIEFTLEERSVGSNAPPEGAPFEIAWQAGYHGGSIAMKHIQTDLPSFLAYLEARGQRLKTLEYRRKTLDDLFIEMTGRRLHG